MISVPATQRRRRLSPRSNTRFRCEPTPRGLDIPDDGLSAFADVYALDRDPLLPLAPMPVESLQQCRVCPRELVSLAQVTPPSLEGLLLI
jgi:hypothetical protein